MITKPIKKIRDLIQPDYVAYKGLKLPRTRSNQGLSNNENYLSETKKQIETAFSDDAPEKTILDFGCGQGRLLNGLVHCNVKFREYVGIDVNNRSIDWCIRHLNYDRNIAFIWYNQKNARYNRSGEDYATIPVKDGHFSHLFANSVFSHLDQEDARKYARLLRGVARRGALLYLTAFTEVNVEDYAENPGGYLGATDDTTPLHRVRYNKDLFLEIFKRSGWKLESYVQNGIERTGQSELLFKAAQCSESPVS